MAVVPCLTGDCGGVTKVLPQEICYQHASSTRNLIQGRVNQELKTWLSFPTSPPFHAPDREMTQRRPRASPHHNRTGYLLAASVAKPLIEGPALQWLM